ncbi:MAG TPA: DUF393 domain-containing protein [Candidatus Methylomirabilis sp.]|nr:DUF393 domain-containing protein [Candidatus Methylomirabilis sp.]
MADQERIHVIYDGQCAFCIRSLRVTRALDVRHALRFHDATDRVAVAARFPALRGADLDTAMYAVTEGGQAYRGFFAFRRIAWSSPLAWPLLLPLYFPGAGWLGPKVYAWVAQNRSNLGCRSRVCPVPPPAGVGSPTAGPGARPGGL